MDDGTFWYNLAVRGELLSKGIDEGLSFRFSLSKLVQIRARLLARHSLASCDIETQVELFGLKELLVVTLKLRFRNSNRKHEL